jgi:hypothetical protein
MVEELFQTVDECIIELEEGRENMSEVARVLLQINESEQDQESSVKRDSEPSSKTGQL